ncbi:hypothetical protein ARMSODRAFT_983952 [Armillaria solidipes]|uniref:Uncharacterized protein n=1 Tax=Armillaria solidipes TaxID=1076256 RepID=A0A2H3AKM5_9AGAR|nr:hypothetical protein ARMSODRAFT_983952 [Armillaria solidipes]
MSASQILAGTEVERWYIVLSLCGTIGVSVYTFWSVRTSPYNWAPRVGGKRRIALSMIAPMVVSHLTHPVALRLMEGVIKGVARPLEWVGKELDFERSVKKTRLLPIFLGYLQRAFPGSNYCLSASGPGRAMIRLEDCIANMNKIADTNLYPNLTVVKDMIQTTYLRRQLSDAEATADTTTFVEYECKVERLSSKIDELQMELNTTKCQETDLRSREKRNMAQISDLEEEVGGLLHSLDQVRTSNASVQKLYQEQCHKPWIFCNISAWRFMTMYLIDISGNYYHDELLRLQAELALVQVHLDEQTQQNLTLEKTIDRMQFETAHATASVTDLSDDVSRNSTAATNRMLCADTIVVNDNEDELVLQTVISKRKERMGMSVSVSMSSISTADDGKPEPEVVWAEQDFSFEEVSSKSRVAVPIDLYSGLNSADIESQSDGTEWYMHIRTDGPDETPSFFRRKTLGTGDTNLRRTRHELIRTLPQVIPASVGGWDVDHDHFLVLQPVSCPPPDRLGMANCDLKCLSLRFKWQISIGYIVLFSRVFRLAVLA